MDIQKYVDFYADTEESAVEAMQDMRDTVDYLTKIIKLLHRAEKTHVGKNVIDMLDMIDSELPEKDHIFDEISYIIKRAETVRETMLKGIGMVSETIAEIADENRYGTYDEQVRQTYYGRR